uniref:Coiled-coil domain containing 195 n=1 Tax=Chinchilla lanigera TaxID=34839 RepID=A0A8C2VB44_CHILA
MEANIQLLRIIQEMRTEINKLEKENQALRIKLTPRSEKTSLSREESGDDKGEEACEQSLASPHGDVMIVRRTKAINKHPYNGVLEVQGTIDSLACSSTKKQDNEEMMLAADSCSSNGSSQRVSPEDGFGCRDKIKTVSFLLPMDLSSYSKSASSLKYSPNRTTNQLSIIAE